MKTPTLRKLACLALGFCLLSTQCYALSQDVMDLGVTAVVNQDLDPMTDALDSAVQSDEVKADSAEDARDNSTGTLSARQSRIEARWTKKLRKRRARTLQRIASGIQAMSEAQVDQTLENTLAASDGTQTVEGLKTLRTKPLSEKRDALISMETAGYDRSVPQLAREIAVSGGIVPFLIHAKKSVREMKENLAFAGKNQNRSPAQVSCKWVKIISIAVAVLAVAAAFVIPGAIFGTWVLVLGAGLMYGDAIDDMPLNCD